MPETIPLSDITRPCSNISHDFSKLITYGIEFSTLLRRLEMIINWSTPEHLRNMQKRQSGMGSAQPLKLLEMTIDNTPIKVLLTKSKHLKPTGPRGTQRFLIFVFQTFHIHYRHRNHCRNSLLISQLCGRSVLTNKFSSCCGPAPAFWSVVRKASTRFVK